MERSLERSAEQSPGFSSLLSSPSCRRRRRTRKSHRMPLISSSLLDQTFEYCYAFFRQERNEVG